MESYAMNNSYTPGRIGDVYQGISSQSTLSAVPDEPSLGTIQCRLSDLLCLMNETASIADGLAERLVGAPPPSSGEIRAVNPAPPGAVPSLYEQCRSLNERLSDIQSTLRRVGRALG